MGPPPHSVINLSMAWYIKLTHQSNSGINDMKQRHIRLAITLTAGAVAALSALTSHAESILYTYQGQALTDHSRYTKSGISSGKAYSPGIGFGFYLEEPLDIGESVSLSYGDGFYTFTGVMGENGAFDSWRFDGWKAPDYLEYSHYSGGLGSDGTDFWTTTRLQTWNTNKPGVWTATTVEALPPGMTYGAPHFITWVSPVPEADASVMALLGLAAAGAMVRRKAPSPTPAQAA